MATIDLMEALKASLADEQRKARIASPDFAARAMEMLLRPGSELYQSKINRGYYVCVDGASGLDVIGPNAKAALEAMLEHLGDIARSDANVVDDHCDICNEYENECTCADDDAAMDAALAIKGGDTE